MARRSTPPIPERPVLTAEQLRRRIERLQNCIQEIEALDLEKVQKRDGDPQVIRVEAAIESALSAAFGHNTPAYMQYRDATQLDKGPRSMRIEPMWGGDSAGHYDAQDTHDARRYLVEGRPRSIGLLQEAIRALEYEIADCEPAKAAETSRHEPTPAATVLYGSGAYPIARDDGQSPPRYRPHVGDGAERASTDLTKSTLCGNAVTARYNLYFRNAARRPIPSTRQDDCLQVPQ
jgi:hypothetical protein